jgi:hypothetical protein
MKAVHVTWTKRSCTICAPRRHIKTEEITIRARRHQEMENYGPWHNTYLAIYFTLTGLHALHILGGSIVIGYLVGAGQQDVENRSRALHQPHRSFRPVLAFCGPGLDFSVPCPYI